MSASLEFAPHETGIIIVDHGSRRAESNAMLLEVVKLFAEQSKYRIIEPAHMELAPPSIADAYASCVQRGATCIVVHPYFLLPGRHWNQDIPQLTAEAAEKFPQTRYLVTAPLGLHPLLSQVITDRIQHCLSHAAGNTEACSVCAGKKECQLHSASG